MHLNACTKPCRWLAPLHYCMPELKTTSTLQKIPKKVDMHRFDAPSNNGEDSFAWGLKAAYVVSALRVFIYHVIMFVFAFAFCGWWLSRYPEDLQGAMVPGFLMLSLLSAFWSMSGILTEGRHKQKTD